MTIAPDGLKAARLLMLDHLDIHENSTAYPTDLDPAEVGIVGDSAHIGGYHCGRDRVKRDSAGNIIDYSVVESLRDKAGLSDYASAIDIGQFSIVVGGKTHNLRTFSLWLVGQCIAGASDTRDIREVIYSPDGVAVKRWDRLGKRTSGDSSHLKHTHISEFRDARGRNMKGLFARYLTYIGLIEGDDMAFGPEQERDLTYAAWRIEAIANGRITYLGGPEKGRPVPLMQRFAALEKTTGLLAEIVARESTNPAEVQALLAELVPTAEQNAEAFVAELDGLGPADQAQALLAVLGTERAAALAVALTEASRVV